MFVSANHSSTDGNQDPMHNSITAWVEVRQRTSIILIPILISRNSSLKYYFFCEFGGNRGALISGNDPFFCRQFFFSKNIRKHKKDNQVKITRGRRQFTLLV